MQNRRASTSTLGALLAMAVVMFAGCTGTEHHTKPSTSPAPTPAPTATPANAATHTYANKARMTCDEELPAGANATRPDHLVLGLISSGWSGGEPGITVITNSGQRYSFLKTYTRVTTTAAPHTTLRVLAPSKARIAYVDASTWTSGQHVEQAILAAATQAVSLASCGSSRTGYAGGLLVKQPSCVKLEVIAHQGDDTRRRHVNVPLGSPC